MANKFHVNTLLLSGVPVTANSTDLYINSVALARANNTGQFITTAQTGQFAAAGSTGQFVTTAQTGQFAPAGMTGQFVTTNKTGQFIDTSKTGQYITVTDHRTLTLDGTIVVGTADIIQTQGAPVSKINFSTAQLFRPGSSSSMLAIDWNSGLLNTGNFESKATINWTQMWLGESGIPILSWTNKSLSGKWDVQALTVGGQNVALSNQTGQYVTSAQTGNFVTTSQTGQFAPAGMTGQFITTAQTGQFTNTFALRSQTGTFITTAQTGQYLLGTNSGIILTTGNQTMAGKKSFLESIYTPAIRVDSEPLSDIALDVANRALYDDGPTAVLDWQAKELAGGWSSNGSSITTSSLTGVLASTGWVNQFFYPRSNPSGYTAGGPGGNVVTTDTQQTITAEKWFTADIRISGDNSDLVIINSGLDRCIVATGRVDSFYQANIINLSTGTNASADLVCSNSTSDVNNYVNLGINSTGYTGASIGWTGDGYLFSMGGDMYVGALAPTRKLFFFAGGNTTGIGQSVAVVTNNNMDLRQSLTVSGVPVATQAQATLLRVTGQTLSGVFSLSGLNIAVSVSGSAIALSGSGVFPALTLLGQSGDFNQNANPNPSNLDIFSKVIAGRGLPYMATPYGSIGIGASPFSRQMAYSTPGSFQNMTTIGHATPVNLGTVTHTGSFFYGYATNFQTAVTPSSTAGHSYSGTNFYFGTGDLRSGNNQGFFFSCQFCIPDTTGAYTTGAQNGQAGQPTGFRIFAGMTDQTLANDLLLNNPTGNRFGLSCVMATGVMAGQSNRKDTNWQMTTCDNNREVLTDTTIPFNSGTFQIYLFVPPPPIVNSAFWRLENQNRGMVATGVIGNRLPIVGTALRPAIGLFSASGVKNIMNYVTYVSS
jgi:hypothetical protein